MNSLVRLWSGVQKTAEKSVNEVGMYLEKQAELRREDIQKERELLKRGSTNERVGRISLEINGAYRLPQRLRIDISSSDNSEKVTTCFLNSDMFSKTKPSLNASLFTSVPILDPASQIILRVYEVPIIPLLPHRYIGTLLIPISNLVHARVAPQSGMSLTSFLHLLSSELGNKFSSCGQFQLFPLSEDRIRYGSMLEDLEEIGMSRPTQSLGILHLHVTLELYTTSLLRTMAESNPLVPPQKSPADYVWWELIRNIVRIRVAYERGVGLTQALRLAQSWEFPIFSSGVAAYLLVLFGFVPVRWMPLTVVLGVAASKLRIRDRAYRQKASEAKPWKEQAWDPPYKTITPIGEALKWQTALGLVQRYLDYVATALERMDNATNWLDVPVSIITYGGATVAAICVGSAIAVFEYVWWRIPCPRLSLSVIAITAILFPRTNGGSGGDSDPPSASNVQLPSSPERRRIELESAEPPLFFALWERYVLRVPDDRELLHRYICAQQQVEHRPSETCSCNAKLSQNLIASANYS
mmetsp:Transcript_11083/g.29757  ORF Transcript_11083/g.29757 Transcript_11083/m.29757 type:complete len:526 (-) Transcript_11083:1126-2703(-)|eukprot:CAMPEP_0185839864 /NCGR_PEP_ID=MMETSP1353-20130828/15307_1 /TAXON_ID=1077150 /ORGANISM="Erythrolobus australicus, Strain CCMP3124" /LENGTH=525 /DNA_ID=CAMNT_0028539095 /DNA_START=278 /DNA_END=1855 /DNA_ORIENTATION=+